jgi:hypothetical protein
MPSVVFPRWKESRLAGSGDPLVTGESPDLAFFLTLGSCRFSSRNVL